VADLFRVPGIALIGPTAFGYPSGPTVRVIEQAFPCRPCTKDGRGKCRRARSCMEEISPGEVARLVMEMAG
jgi:heptosyltransferase-2